MQTFLPLPSFRDSSRILDYRRLGKQRVEAKQILDCLAGVGSLRWRNHPAVRMWKGFDSALASYMDACIDEWIRRGYRNTMVRAGIELKALPPWFGDEQFHASHRSNLLRKDLKFYSQYGWSEGPDLSYVWPA